jgi:hypothetical protein
MGRGGPKSCQKVSVFHHYLISAESLAVPSVLRTHERQYPRPVPEHLNMSQAFKFCHSTRLSAQRLWGCATNTTKHVNRLCIPKPYLDCEERRDLHDVCLLRLARKCKVSK